MILEVADLRIVPGCEAAFEDAVQFGVSSVIAKAKGFRSGRVHRCIESPQRYVLLLEWETLEDHTVEFRGSSDFSTWRAIVFEYFAQPPLVEHFEGLSTHLPA